MEYGVQMYSLRDITDKDLDGALKAVSEMGYKNVEFAGFFGHSAADVRAMLEKYNLRVIATHTGYEDFVEDFEGAVKYHKELGNKRIVIPAASLKTREKLDNFINICNELSPKLRAEGLELGYHNHDFEFRPTEEGYHIHEELRKRTDLFFELDTYWTFVAKVDPVKELEILGDRVKMIHLKDGTPDGDGLALGEGSAPVAAVKAKAVEMGLDIVVESEGCEPTGKEEVERCIKYLKSLG